MHEPRQCPNCGALCLETETRCRHCRCSLGIGWVRWLPGVSAAAFALLMGAFLLFVAMPATQKSGRPDKTMAIAINLTNTIFICGSAVIGGMVGWVIAWMVKATNKN